MLNRRTLIKSLGAGAALLPVAAAHAKESPRAESAVPEKWDETYDVIVVGAGVDPGGKVGPVDRRQPGQGHRTAAAVHGGQQLAELRHIVQDVVQKFHSGHQIEKYGNYKRDKAPRSRL